MVYVFFFQAEDGIRDADVTGVQTCALPISRIGRVDVSKALAMPGVVAAFSGQDLADWTGPLLMAWPVTEDINNPPHWPLAKDKARYQGDGVAVVVAESRAQAADAAEVV